MATSFTLLAILVSVLLASLECHTHLKIDPKQLAKSTFLRTALECYLRVGRLLLTFAKLAIEGSVNSELHAESE
ncbi:hypothetical protein DM02DRAFT_678033 [Periconia macrospinosa]|uniref:Uncharacterized protein n=1 Tax=Periconia macrospinosa TaxID=97972 RepID=A0A2V1D0M1_9PLEO|nr:hypothetical protein DM02DRAFT_678033 [Periconia macrospinosa]